MPSKTIVVDEGQDFVIQVMDRSFGGRRTDLLRLDGKDLNLLTTGKYKIRGVPLGSTGAVAGLEPSPQSLHINKYSEQSEEGSITNPFKSFTAAVAYAASQGGNWDFFVGAGDYRDEPQVTIPKGRQYSFIARGGFAPEFQWVADTGGLLFFERLGVGKITVVDSTSPSLGNVLAFQDCECGGVVSTGASATIVIFIGTSFASFLTNPGLVASSVNSEISLTSPTSRVFATNTQFQNGAAQIQVGDLYASGCSFSQNIMLKGTAEIRQSVYAASNRTITFVGAYGDVHWDLASNDSFLQHGGSHINGRANPYPIDAVPVSVQIQYEAANRLLTTITKLTSSFEEFDKPYSILGWSSDTAELDDGQPGGVFKSVVAEAATANEAYGARFAVRSDSGKAFFACKMKLGEITSTVRALIGIKDVADDVAILLGYSGSDHPTNFVLLYDGLPGSCSVQDCGIAVDEAWHKLVLWYPNDGKIHVDIDDVEIGSFPLTGSTGIGSIYTLMEQMGSDTTERQQYVDWYASSIVIE